MFRSTTTKVAFCYRIPYNKLIFEKIVQFYAGETHVQKETVFSN
ncbi:hypothetical protein GRFL_2522 [Christiangramia flava JLT2011]|uniref:Uncharacterized protein n=1 Tax=Christiangramia flava JLT2011 TaxID=1229726 RepID=A0A1L7I6N4_9FLAO|nr:hypothetical protein GRFL_2522 [Christiangramia flava JLT2011]